MRKQRYEDEKYERKIASIHLWIKYYAKKSFVSIPILVGSLVVFSYLFILSPGIIGFGMGHADDDRIVSIEQEHLDYLEEDYDPNLENGYCVFGYKTDSEFIVEEIEQATIHKQTKHSVNFDCIDRIWERKEDLLLDKEYKLIGDIHTHPPRSSNSLSYVDTGGTTISNLITYELRGVYHIDDGLGVYTSESLQQPLPLEVR